MKTGDLRRRITIQVPTIVRTGTGGQTVTWTDHATVWAKAWSVSGSESMNDMKINMLRIQKFCIRYRSKLLPSWRIKYGTKYFNITGIDPDEKKRFLYITVEESV